MSDPAAKTGPRQLSRQWLYGPFLLFGAIVFVYFLVWRAAAVEIEKGVLAWAEQQRAAGAQISWRAIRRDGFPFFLRVHIDRPSIEWPGALTWSGDRLTLDALPYDLDRMIISLPGNHAVTGNGALWALHSDKALASVESNAARGWILNAETSNARLANQTTGQAIALGGARLSASPHPDDPSRLMIGVAVRDLSIDDGLTQQSLDSIDASIGVDAFQLLAAGYAPAEWRAGNGGVDFLGVTIAADSALASLTGRLTPSPDGFATGEMKARIVNPAEWTQRMQRFGLINATDAKRLGAQLTLLSIASGGALETPIEVAADRVTVAGVDIPTPR